jgi:large subunit ribosomal protein L21
MFIGPFDPRSGEESMYAVIRTGGKQVRVAKGDVIQIERFPKKTFVKGDALELPEVLAVGDGDTLRLGSPLVAGATVHGVVVRETRGPKLIVYKKKKRKGYQRSHGHRQNLIEVRIDSISA